MKIEKLEAYEILDSRGNPTVQAEVTLEDGTFAKASVPSGASTGSREALELRDGNADRFLGKGVLKACFSVNESIFPAIADFSVFDQEGIDQAMIDLDGTENKSSLGANAILAVSLATARAAALQKKVPLWQHIQETYGLETEPDYDFPVPMMNVINGGAHADSGLDIQEFMLVPSGIRSFFEKVRAGAEIYHTLRANLIEMGYRVAVGDEGGFAPNLGSNEEALQVINQAIEKAGYALGREVSTGLDAAASEFYDKESQKYNLKLDNASLDSNTLSAMYGEWIEKYNLELIEDPMSEFDQDGWEEFTKRAGEKISVIGDDLLVTNEKLIAQAIERKSCNAVLIKVNQIGSLSETIAAIKLAKNNGMKVAVSHRSGETCDNFIADLAVAVSAEYLKSGAPARGERAAKYNRVVEIERSK